MTHNASSTLTPFKPPTLFGNTPISDESNSDGLSCAKNLVPPACRLPVVAFQRWASAWPLSDSHVICILCILKLLMCHLDSDYVSLWNHYPPDKVNVIGVLLWPVRRSQDPTCGQIITWFRGTWKCDRLQDHHSFSCNLPHSRLHPLLVALPSVWKRTKTVSVRLVMFPLMSSFAAKCPRFVPSASLS